MGWKHRLGVQTAQAAMPISAFCWRIVCSKLIMRCVEVFGQPSAEPVIAEPTYGIVDLVLGIMSMEQIEFCIAVVGVCILLWDRGLFNDLRYRLRKSYFVEGFFMGCVCSCGMWNRACGLLVMALSLLVIVTVIRRPARTADSSPPDSPISDVGQQLGLQDAQLEPLSLEHRDQASPFPTILRRRPGPHHEAKSTSRKESVASRPKAKKDAPRTLIVQSWRMSDCVAIETDPDVVDYLEKVAPQALSMTVLRSLVQVVQESLGGSFPEAQFVGVTHTNLLYECPTGFKQEAEIIVVMQPELLAERLTANFQRQASKEASSSNSRTRPRKSPKLDLQNLQKTATRALTEQLHSNRKSRDAFRYWTSAFRSVEPCLALLAPGTECGDICINFLVNGFSSIRLAAVLSVAGALETQLIVLVRRWAIVRGLCLTTKGFMNTYAWAVLTWHFLQLRDGRRQSLDQEARASAQLLVDFADSCLSWFGADSKHIEIELPERAFDVPHVSGFPEASLHQELATARSQYTYPVVVDPFETSRDLAATLNDEGAQTIIDEFLRLQELARKGARLAEYLRPRRLKTK